MTENIKKMIESMTVDEMKQRLAEYMAADQQLAPRPIAVEVRLSNINNVRCRYDVLLIGENGQETEVKFRDRYSRLVYIYTLLHPQGYQRRLAAANNYKALRQLYTMLYFKESDALVKTIESTDFDHFFSHYIAQSRNAIRQATSSVDMFLRDIRKSEPLSSAEEHELWRLMRQGCQRARSKFIYANLRYVVTIAKKYLASGTAFEDLLMAGSLGITRAADMFDASLGFRFISFATWYIECEARKAAYDHIKHNNTTVSLDEPIYSEEDDSETMISCMPSSTDAAPDWHVRYDDTLNALKRGLDKQYWEGTGEMLDEYLSMMEKGYTTSDFARKYRLNDQQMRRFLDMIRAESRHFLKAAA